MIAFQNMVENFIDAGMNIKVWSSSDGKVNRVYFQDIRNLLDFTYAQYGSGSISKASVDGEKISNSKATKLKNTKVYIDDKCTVVLEWANADIRSKYATRIEQKIYEAGKIQG